MNKAELIDALAARLGDKRTATEALDAVLAEIQTAVTKGDRVAITGFGAFEKRVRGARTARNPRTGETVKVKKTSVPAFKAGAGFKEMVASGKAPKTTAPKKTATAARGATKTAARATTTRAAAKTTTAARKTTTAKAGAAKTTTARKTAAAAAKPAAAKATARKAPARTAAKATTRSTARKTTTAAGRKR